MAKIQLWEKSLKILMCKELLKSDMNKKIRAHLVSKVGSYLVEGT